MDSALGYEVYGGQMSRENIRKRRDRPRAKLPKCRKGGLAAPGPRGRGLSLNCLYLGILGTLRCDLLQGNFLIRMTLFGPFRTYITEVDKLPIV
jgi:hypothetical protein